MRRAYFYGEGYFAFAVVRARDGRNIDDGRNIEMPPDSGSIPILPDEERDPPVDAPPDRRPTRPEDEPDPPPIREPNPDEPTRVF
jgi:hypothetical protein